MLRMRVNFVGEPTPVLISWDSRKATNDRLEEERKTSDDSLRTLKSALAGADMHVVNLELFGSFERLVVCTSQG